jgi:ribosomal-protein-serine acetyltransferase
VKTPFISPNSQAAQSLIRGAVPGLRPVEAADGQQIHAGLRESMGQIAPWMPWCHPGYSMEEACRWGQSRASAWAIGEAYDFVIIDPITSRIAGVCGLTSISRNNNFANLGYWVRTSCTNRGLATLAARCVARFGFEHLGLSRIEIVVAVGNAASLRVAQKTGALREGVLRNRSVVNERTFDAVMFSLIPADFQNAASAPEAR